MGRVSTDKGRDRGNAVGVGVVKLAGSRGSD